VFNYQVNAQGRLSDPQQFGDIVLRAGTASEATLRLRDVARIELGALQYNSTAFLNDRPSVGLAVYQLPDANALALQNQIKSKVEELSKRFPKGLQYTMAYDTTRFVSASIHDVVITLAEAMLLVFAVVYVFLQSWRTTLIPAIAIPVSLIATFAVMKAVGFSINTVSLLGMVLAIGLVVDDAIVVVENVERQLEAGLPPLQAAKKAMAEVTGPIIATTAVLMAVFVPVAFLPGITGRLYNQFALTIAISMALSAINSLTLSPALSAVLLRHRGAPRFVLFRKFNDGFNWLSHAYANGVRHAIGARRVILAIFAGGIALAYGIYSRIPTTFLPVEDQGYFFVVIRLPDGSSLQRTDTVAERVRKILHEEDGVSDVITVSGLNYVTKANQSSAAAAFAILKPWDERSALPAGKILASARQKLRDIPEATVLGFEPPSIPGLGTFGGFEFQVEDLTGKGPQAIDELTQALIAEAKKQPEINAQTVLTTFSTTTPQYDYDLDRSKAKLLGLTLPDVFNTMQIYLGSLYVNDFNAFGRTFRVTLQADKDARANPTDLSQLYVRNHGQEVRLTGWNE
jgi:HAE1 family hydrophobic/amphiphilic exporter-1